MKAPVVPAYLKRYCKAQDYSRYSSREHATWRFILRQSRDYFSKHAVPCYLEGLKRTGISIEEIPSIERINSALQEFGWGAVGVCGFIPPAAFLDFQSRRIMPIAMDMRTLEHVAYTPAPDIVHEAAGHLPILVDENYRKYLIQYAAMARKAIVSREDIDVYEAIRVLSDIKENPDTKAEEIRLAQADLNRKVALLSESTELSKVARMNWWTAEYGLVGDLKNPKIYGAGLLSSVGESRHCLTDAVRKVPLSIRCVEQAYDITEPQPQLFVAESLEQLPEVLEELDRTLSYRVGGIPSLERAYRSEMVSSVVCESGVSASGVVERYIAEKECVIFLKFKGPAQLAFNEKEISGQGRDRHAHGFSSPLGRWKAVPNKAASGLSDSELSNLGFSKGKRAKLEFQSGFVIEGEIFNWIRIEGRLAIVQWKDATVMRGKECYFKPEWGEFDQLVGEGIPSVFGGPADRERYGEYELGRVSTAPGRTSPYTEQEKEIFGFYQVIREQRETLRWSAEEFLNFAMKTMKSAPNEWLLDLELYEILKQNSTPQYEKLCASSLEKTLNLQRDQLGPVVRELIGQGLALSASK